MTGRKRFVLTMLASLGAALLFPPARASAHILDSALVVADAPVGPYRLSVWTFATTVEEATIHITSRLTDPETGAPVLAANVRYVVQDVQGQRQAIVLEATPASPLNGFLFEGNVPLPEFDSYRVTVVVNDVQDRGGEVAYVYPVFPLSGVMQVVVIVMLVIGLAATVWLIREGALIFARKGDSHGDD